MAGGSHYKAGRRFEWEFCKWAEAKYACSAHRLAGSHSIVDIILIPIFTGIEDKRTPLESVVVCQLKRSKEKPTKEWKDYHPVGCIKWWVSKPKNVRFEDMTIDEIRI